MTITQLGDLAQWLQVAQSVVAIIGFPILIKGTPNRGNAGRMFEAARPAGQPLFLEAP